MSRGRSETAHQKVLDAAIELFAERGIDATSMDAIAESSTVSKATIYKHWRDKEALALEVLEHLHGLDQEEVRFDSGNLRRDLINLLNYQPTAELRETKERIMPHMIAYSARNREFGTLWRKRMLERPRTQLREMMMRNIAKGLLNKKLKPEVGIALLIGPMMYQRIFLKDDNTLPTDLARQVVDAFLAAYGRP